MKRARELPPDYDPVYPYGVFSFQVPHLPFFNNMKGLTESPRRTLGVHISPPLSFDSTGAIRLNIARGLRLQNGALAPQLGRGLSIDSQGNIQTTDTISFSAPLAKADSGAVTLRIGEGLSVEGDALRATPVRVQEPLKKIGDLISLQLGAGLALTGDALTALPPQVAEPLQVTNGRVGLRLGSGLTVGPQGLQLADNLAFSGALQKIGQTISLQVGPGLEVVADRLRLKTGAGLEVVGDVLKVKPGAGVELRGDAVAVRSGPGLELTSPGVLQVKPGGGLQLAQGGALQVKTGNGLQLAQSGVLQVNPGNGLQFSQGALQVNAGNGLRISQGALQVNPGGGLQLEQSGALQVKAGDGLQLAQGGSLQVVAGPGLVVRSNSLAVNHGAGLEINANQLRLKLGEGLQLTSAGALQVPLGPGLQLDGGRLAVKTGAGVQVSGDGALQFNIQAGGGLSLQGNSLSVNAGPGLTINNGALTMKLGSGLGTDASGLLFIRTGPGLSLNGGNVIMSLGPGLQFSNNRITIATASGLEIRDNRLSLRAGSGLFMDRDGILKPHLGPNMHVVNSTIRAKAGAGIASDDTGLSVRVANPIAIDTSSAVSLLYKEPLHTEADGSQQRLALNIGEGLQVTGGKLQLKVGNGLRLTSEGTLTVPPEGQRPIITRWTGPDPPTNAIISGNTPNVKLFLALSRVGDLVHGTCWMKGEASAVNFPTSAFSIHIDFNQFGHLMSTANLSAATQWGRKVGNTVDPQPHHWDRACMPSRAVYGHGTTTRPSPGVSTLTTALMNGQKLDVEVFFNTRTTGEYSLSIRCGHLARPTGTPTFVTSYFSFSYLGEDPL
ncbi:fibre protein [Equine adenovirus 1]|uniref:Fibre protein n=1 Tax=Equine adenovirus A serotype 1 TaxID=46916 RepID=G5CZ95_ADEE1|nr:fibre protein [Equine adenovirus 1]AEP16425.1 fibre protein [Equine adenovirus 1]